MGRHLTDAQAEIESRVLEQPAENGEAGQTQGRHQNDTPPDMVIFEMAQLMREYGFSLIDADILNSQVYNTILKQKFYFFEENTMKKRAYGASLHGKIMKRALLIGFLPLLIISSFWLYSFHQLNQDASTLLSREESRLMEITVGDSIQAVAELTMNRVDGFLLERISDARDWASTPIVIDAAVQAAQIHSEEGFSGMPIAEVEEIFKEEKTLNISPDATNYLLRQIENSPYFGEIFFTDRYGFNVAVTNRTSDFVQRDENWWKSAWENGISISEVEYDESARVWSISISMRIDNPVTGNSEGVMKTVLDISTVQGIADSQSIQIEGGEISIVNEAGLFIAETENDHLATRIMNRSANLRRANEEAYNVIFGNEPQGFLMTKTDAIGFARSAGSDFYRGAVPRFSGFEWRAVVRQPDSFALEPINGLKKIQASIGDYRSFSNYVLIVTAVIILLFTVVLARSLAQKITVPLVGLTKQADLISKGQANEKVTIEESDDEIEDLSKAFERMRSAIAVLITRVKEKSKG